MGDDDDGDDDAGDEVCDRESMNQPILEPNDGFLQRCQRNAGANAATYSVGEETARPSLQSKDHDDGHGYAMTLRWHRLDPSHLPEPTGGSVSREMHNQ